MRDDTCDMQPAQAGEAGDTTDVVAGPSSDMAAIGRRVARHCAAYREPDTRRALIEIAATFLPLCALMAAMVVSLDYGYWITLLLSVPAGALLMRMFIIQHDCGHGSFLPSKRANDWLGRTISLITFTPYAYWRRAHALHHATSGNLDRRGVGDVTTWTVREYYERPWYIRMWYRIYRNPFVLLGFGAPFHFAIRQRVPGAVQRPFWDTWGSTIGLNLALIAVYGSLGMLIGFSTLLMLFVPVVLFGSWIGGWLFYIQHQFEDTHWDENENWDFHSAAILGSSYYVLPKPLQWLSGSIGLHHLHHLCSRIPFYRLQECLDASPELKSVNCLTFRESLGTWGLALWDEEERKLVGFRRSPASRSFAARVTAGGIRLGSLSTQATRFVLVLLARGFS